MNVVDENGDYKLVTGTKTNLQSDHPVYQARIEMALGKGKWCFAPNRGHQLKTFDRVNQSSAQIESFEKELRLYLSKYDPETIEVLSSRGLSQFNLEIKEDALDGQNT